MDEKHLSIISQQEAKLWGVDTFVAKSKAISRIVEDIRKAQSTDTTSVLITGESGTGKELIARAIHFGSSRAKGKFIPVNCSSIPSGLAESILFGHVRGAFTGAESSHKGYFELADGGTLFLDEINDMPIDLQTKLLRVLEDGFYTPVGAENQRRADVRILASTNVDLLTKITEGAFQKALYFRLARFPIEVPPLRERREDIPLLVEHFLSLFSEKMGIERPALSDEAKRALETYHFPGNVRELKNMIESALIESNDSTIQPEHLRFISPFVKGVQGQTGVFPPFVCISIFISVIVSLNLHGMGKRRQWGDGGMEYWGKD